MPLPSEKAETISITRMSLGKSVEIQKAVPAVSVDSLTPQRIIFLPQAKELRLFSNELNQPLVIASGEEFDAIYALVKAAVEAAAIKTLS